MKASPIHEALRLATLILLSLAQDEQARRALDISVRGRLQQAVLLALPCFALYNGQPTGVDAARCASVRGNYTNAGFRAGEPAGYMSEQCWSDPTDQCTLDNTVSPAPEPPRGAVCNQGSVPACYLEVREAAGVGAAFAFAKTHGTPLVVENSGHDYVTRKSGKGALALWVHGLSGLEFHEDFVPEGVLSPAYRLGVDRVVQFKIITPDGVLRVANKCQYADLFWALRGGGGGTFGVVFDATHRVEPAGLVTVASITLPSNTTADIAMRWIELMAGESLAWGRQGWGGHAAGMYLTYMNPLPAIANSSDGGLAARASMKNATDFAASAGGTSVIEIFPDFIIVWNKYVVSGAQQTAGQVRVLSSRLIPRSLFENDEGIVKLMNYFAATRDLGFDPRRYYCPVDIPFVTDAVKHGEAGKTAVNPAWYHSLWSMGGASVSIPWNASYAVRLQNLTALTKATLLAKDKPFTRNWREPQWADNYPRLLKIKQKYDPDGLLKCWKCVGFDDPDTDSERFSCQAKLQRDIDESLS
ncbi:hypothetical protein F4809DRAFT_655734 [Biscogniauxia mediterranea]|nr:hypothetical protein F4809DRAFT_655734 [Biscogniauxia mediterranea]